MAASSTLISLSETNVTFLIDLATLNQGAHIQSGYFSFGGIDDCFFWVQKVSGGVVGKLYVGKFLDGDWQRNWQVLIQSNLSKAHQDAVLSPSNCVIELGTISTAANEMLLL